MIKPDYIIRSYRKTLCISISKKGEVIVRAPKRLPLEYISKFIADKESWIKLKKQQMELINNQNKSIYNHEKLLLLGVEYTRKDVTGIKKIEWDENSKVVYFPDNLSKPLFIKYASSYYINQAKEIIIDRVEYFAKLMSLTYNSISLMNNKTRWGYCTKKGDIKFNWRIAMLKPKTIDYIIIHELAHLIEFNHSKRFYKIIECVMPNYKSQSSELKKRGYLLETIR